LHREFADAGFSVLAVDVRNDRSGTEAFYSEFGFEVPNVFDTRNVAVAQYGVSATPTTYLVDEEGRIVYRRYGYLPGEELRLREQIESLLER
jgi:thioredoxin-related protein